MLKKFISVFLINFFISCIFLSFLELYLYHNHKKNYPEISYQIKKFPYKDILSLYKFRQPVGLNFSSRPIVFLGCSYAYGQGLNEHQTVSFKLSQLTNRPVYNYSLPGKGLQNTLFLLQHNFLDPNIKDPQYFIYIFMYDQIRRLYSTVCLHDFTGFPIYKLDSNGNLFLKSDYYPVYKQFYSYYFFNNIFYIYFYSHFLSHHSKLISAYFKAINLQLKKQYPNSKFVILMYDDNSNNYGLNLSSLESDDIKIIHTNDLSDVILSNDQYHLSKNDFHPNEKAWDALLPQLIKILGL